MNDIPDQSLETDEQIARIVDQIRSSPEIADAKRWLKAVRQSKKLKTPTPDPPAPNIHDRFLILHLSKDEVIYIIEGRLRALNAEAARNVAKLLKGVPAARERLRMCQAEDEARKRRRAKFLATPAQRAKRMPIARAEADAVALARQTGRVAFSEQGFATPDGGIVRVAEVAEK